MNSRLHPLLILTLILFLVGPRLLAAPGERNGELLVKWRGGPGSNAAIAGNRQIGSTVKRTFSVIGWQQVQLPPGMGVAEGIAAYRALDAVLAVEPNAPLPNQPTPPHDDLAGTSVLEADGIAEDEPFPGIGLKGESTTPAPVIPNDKMFSGQWALKKIGLTNAWSVTTGSTNVVVAVIDSGVTYNHEDLAANMWRNPGETGLDANGRDKATNGIDDDGDGIVDDVYGADTSSDTLGNDGDPLDEGYFVSGGGREYHGTAVAGIIGAVGNNRIGLAGVNWSVRLMAVRAGKTNNLNLVADTIAGFEYVVTMKRRGVNVRVTNNSYSIDPFGVGSQALKDAIDAAGDEGILNLFAAGNSGVNLDDADIFPQRYNSPSVVCVAASDQSDALASFSNYGRTGADLAAPGDSLTATLGPKPTPIGPTLAQRPGPRPW